MTNYFLIDEVVIDYHQQPKVTLSLLASTYEALEEVRKSISSGKIQITSYEEEKESSSVAEKFRQETINNTIKAIYAGIEKTVADYGFTFGTYLSNMTPQSHNKIVQEFESIGFQVNYEADRNYLKINWK